MRSRSQGRGPPRITTPQNSKPSLLSSNAIAINSPMGAAKATRLPLIANSPGPSGPGSLFSNIFDDSSSPLNYAQQMAQMTLAQPHNVYTQASQAQQGVTVGVCSQQGRRPYQEDEFAIRPFLSKSSSDPETHFFGLFDGHAGGRCSSHLSQNLPAALADDELFSTNIGAALKRSFHAVNEQFLKVAEKHKLHDGSTGLCVVIRDQRLTIANVGDCRAVLVSTGGTARAPTCQVVQLSNDQKPTCIEEQKRIISLGGCVVNCMGVARVNRVLAVSRAFGNRTLRSVIRPDAELTQRELSPNDEFLVMASDGLWDVLRNKDVGDVCLTASLQRRPQAIADELVSLALQRGSQDNVTAVVVPLNGFLSVGSGNATAAGPTDLLPNGTMRARTAAGERERERLSPLNTAAGSPRNHAMLSQSMPLNVSSNHAQEFRRQMEQSLQGSHFGNIAAGAMPSSHTDAERESESAQRPPLHAYPRNGTSNGSMAPPPLQRNGSLSQLERERPLTVDGDRLRNGALLSNSLSSRPLSLSGPALSLSHNAVSQQPRASSTQRMRQRDESKTVGEW